MLSYLTRLPLGTTCLRSGSAAVLAGATLVVFACSETGAPMKPNAAPLSTTVSDGAAVHDMSQGEDKGYIDGWLDGQDVQLYYTKSYFCAEPPSSGAPSNCEIGAPPDVAARPGQIPTIYAIAPVGFRPDPSTLACLAGSPCLNHPAMIDASRVGGATSAPALSHSHILERRAGGWFVTVNIRVFSEAAWNEIATAKSLSKVRELQAANPAVGVPGVISADTPTNIYFFIAGER
jgi:hypothetical protein